MAVTLENVDKIVTSDGTEHDLDNMSFGAGALSEMTNTSIINPQNGDALVWDIVTQKWAAESEVTVIPIGEAVFTTAGTYTWTCPAGVTEVSAVCVGGGAAGWKDGSNNPQCGAGGGLGWISSISVTPGTDYTVVTGGGVAKGVAGNGGDSYIQLPDGSIPVAGYGGAAGGAGGGFVGDGGGHGGSGPYYAAGGAGGYSGNGGGVNQNGSGGGGAGNKRDWTKEGGGVGIYGEGASGIYDAYGANQYKQAGSGGGVPNFGGGTIYPTTVASGTGAVRIIWGYGRSFPNNAA